MKATDQILLADTIGPECDVPALLTELQQSLDGSEIYIAQQMRAHDTAYCLWPGQTDDGRQWDENLGGADTAFPWDGASDQRVFHVDGIAKERCRIKMAAWRRMRVQATALRGNASEKAQNVTTVLSWLFGTHRKAQIERQLALCAWWTEVFGYSALAVWWKEDIRVKMQSITVKELRDTALLVKQQTGDGSILRMLATMMDPARDEQALALVRLMAPLASKRGARKILDELRTTGKSDYPVRDVVSSLPFLKALRPFVDLFFPSRTDDFQSARWMARRQWLTEAQFRAMGAQNEWDEEWMDEVLAKGRGQSFDLTVRRHVMAALGEAVPRNWWMDSAEQQHLVEIVWHYRLGIHEDYDLPILNLSVYCPAVPTSYGYHGPAETDNYPFFPFTAEDIDDPIAEARGVAELAKGFQQQLKNQRDNFTNRSDINIIPPLLVSAGNLMGKSRLPWRPGYQQPVKKNEKMEYLAIPNSASDAANVTQAVERESDRYFARLSDHVHATAQQLGTEEVAGRWLTQMTEPTKCILALMQQFLPDETVAQIVGPQNVANVKQPIDAIRGSFDLQLTFNADDLNFELLIKKLEAWKNLLLPADTIGATNRHVFLQWGARALDRDMADQLIMEPQEAGMQQVQEAKQAMNDIMAGIEPGMKPEGQAAALQLQVVQQILQNTELQKRLREQPDSMLLLKRFVDHLQFMQQQTKNAETGRVGVPELDWRSDLKPRSRAS